MPASLRSGMPHLRRNRLLQAAVVLLLFLVGTLVRLYDLTDPPLDFHPTRQLRSAIIARGLYYQSLDPSPQRDLALKALGSMEVYEPPIIEALVAGAYRLAGGEHLWYARIFSTFFWLVAASAMLLLLRRWRLGLGALLALGFFQLLTFSIQASRSFQPDPFMVMWISLFCLALDVWLEKRSWRWAVLTGLAGGMAVLVKVTAGLFIGAVLLSAVLFSDRPWKVLRSAQVWTLGLLCVLPPAGYYLLAIGSRSASFFASWTVGFLHLLADHTFYADWLHMAGSLVSLPFFFAALLGSLLLPPGPRRLMLGLWAGYVLYGLTSPFQFITHEYYHLPLVLIVSLGVAVIGQFVLEQVLRLAWPWRTTAWLVLLFIAGYAAWVGRSVLFSRDFRSEARVWAAIGKAVPTDGGVIALTQDFGNRLKYYGWTTVRSYWQTTSSQQLQEVAGNPPEDVQQQFEQVLEGNRYFLVTMLSQLDQQPELKTLLEGYQVVSSGDGYVIYDLTRPLSP